MKKKVWLLLVPILCMSGCGGAIPRAPVKGKVTVAGKGPLTGGSIQFVSVADAAVVGGGQIKADGSYEVPDAPIGECKVVIANEFLKVGGKTIGAAVPIGTGMPGMPGKGGPVAGGGKPPAEASGKMNKAPTGLDTTGVDTGEGPMKYLKISLEFQDKESTPLKFTVSRGDNTKDFEVK